jgi:hypothetical protein
MSFWSKVINKLKGFDISVESPVDNSHSTNMFPSLLLVVEVEKFLKVNHNDYWEKLLERR